MDRAASSQMLRVALDANAAAYRRAVQTSVPGDCWDVVVLTAANEKQAAGYRRELALRHRAVGPTGAFFPEIQQSIVIPDPPGRRAGSGGATFAVLKALATEHGFGNDVDKLRVLLIHSGGASQRLPAYSPLGKIFAPLPLLRPDGQIATLFDHLYITLAGLPERLGPGMLVVAGDVFLMLDHRHVQPPPNGVTALSMRVDADLGRGHGVFVTDSAGSIQRTLQKVSIEEMQKEGACDAHGRVLIDTGLLFFDPASVSKLTEMSGVPVRSKRASARVGKGIHERHKDLIDLYEDMTAALAGASKKSDYTSPMRRELFAALHPIDFRVMQLDGEFLHLGTTRQFRDAMIGLNPSPAAELFQQNVLAHSAWQIDEGRRVYHSVLLAGEGVGGSLGAGSVVEHSILRAPSTIGRGSIVSQVETTRRPIALGNDRLFFQVPVRDAKGKSLVVHVVCGVEDDYKGRFSDLKCRYLNEPIDRWFAATGAKPEDLWRGIAPEQRTLWTARLFIATPTRDDPSVALRIAEPDRRVAAAWRKLPRFSMAMILESADADAMIEHREVVTATLQANEMLQTIRKREDRPLESVIGRYATAAAYNACESQLADWSHAPAGDAALAIDQARALWCVAQLLQRPDHPSGSNGRERISQTMTSAFAKVAEASEAGSVSIEVSDRNKNTRPISHKPGVEITATSPVRLDLAGGWTDTPPYCFERGGHVVNLSIDLQGRPPVRAIVTTTREPKIILESHDLGRSIELKEADLRGPVDVRDPFALHKVAMAMARITPATLKNTGLRVATECRVPKGSGLGTSSILGSTLLAALYRLGGQNISIPNLTEQTLLLEQRLSTGGGWQDQVGGIVGGVKSTITPPGVPQRPVVETLALSDAQYLAIEERLVVYYSGQQRLARDILRRVMGRWLAREPAGVMLLDDLKRNAVALRAAILKSQWPAVGREIARYWQIKRELYPGSTTPTIDVLLIELRENYLAANLAGAGGGGFGYFFCRDRKQATHLRERLTERSSRPGSLGNVYDTQINRTGLTVVVAKSG